MSVVVKVCGLTHADDVAAAVAAGADALGFVFAKSPRRVSPEHAAEISRGVPSDVLRVAVMLHPADAEWRAVAETFRPDVLQTDAGDFGSLEVPAEVMRWPVFRQSEAVSDGPGAGTYVYEGARSGAGTTVDWDVAARLARKGQMILAGGLGPHNVAEAIRQVRPYGVDASSSLERAPGRKDKDKVAAFVNAAKFSETRLPT